MSPIGFLIFLISAFAETNRLPFDLPESEQELIGGFHTEYSGMKFGMFFLGEYVHVITVSFLTVILFGGGWDFPFLLDQYQTGIVSALVKVMVILVKVTLVILFIMWVRRTLLPVFATTSSWILPGSRSFRCLPLINCGWVSTWSQRATGISCNWSGVDLTFHCLRDLSSCWTNPAQVEAVICNNTKPKRRQQRFR